MVPIPRKQNTTKPNYFKMNTTKTKPYTIEYQKIETYSDLMLPNKSGKNVAKPLQIDKPIMEHPDEELSDNSVHRHYRVPTVAMRANPFITMNYEVQRDALNTCPTPLSLNRWVSTEYLIWDLSASLAESNTDLAWTSHFNRHHHADWQRIKAQCEKLADLPDRFLQKIPPPPFFAAEITIQSTNGGLYFPICAPPSGEMITSPFWGLWLLILYQQSDSVGGFSVVLRIPTFPLE